MDALSLSIVVSELSERVVPSQLRKIYEMSPSVFLLDLWAGRQYWLVISLEGAHRRIHLVESKSSPSATPSSFCMFFRKHFQGLSLSGITQPHLERLVRLQFSTRDGREIGTAIVELFGREGNLYLLDENEMIIRTLRPPSPSRRRDDRTFVMPPPPASKYDPFEIDSIDRFRAVIAGARGIPQDLLGRSFLALSREYAQEIVDCADLPEEKMLEDFTDEELRSLFASWERFWRRIKDRRVNPVMILDEGVPAGWGLWLYRRFQEAPYRKVSSLNELFSEYYRKKNLDDDFELRRKKILDHIRARLSRAERRYNVLREDLERAEESLRGRQRGELILLNTGIISRGMSSVEVEDVYASPPSRVSIPLDPILSAAENAQKYFEKYKKSKRGVTIMSSRREDTLKEIEYWRGLATCVEQAADPEVLEHLDSELFPVSPARKEIPLPSGPRRFVFKNREFLVGRGPRENDELSLKIARPDDLWFHARQMAGAHVVLRMAGHGDDVPRDVLLRGAMLAAYYSKGKKSAKVPVDYTRAKYVKKIRHLPPGMVLIDREKNIVANPQDPEFQEWVKEQGHQ